MKLILAILIALTFGSPAFAHDHGRTDPAWEATPPHIQHWYNTLMMPDVPNMKCCGESDAYWCDKINVRQGKTYCTITDDRPDEPMHRPHIPVGTEIEIPNHKLKWDKGNPTGHTIVFLRAHDLMVYCFVQGTGI